MPLNWKVLVPLSILLVPLTTMLGFSTTLTLDMLFGKVSVPSQLIVALVSLMLLVFASKELVRVFKDYWTFEPGNYQRKLSNILKTRIISNKTQLRLLIIDLREGKQVKPFKVSFALVDSLLTDVMLRLSNIEHMEDKSREWKQEKPLTQKEINLKVAAMAKALIESGMLSPLVETQIYCFANNDREGLEELLELQNRRLPKLLEHPGFTPRVVSRITGVTFEEEKCSIFKQGPTKFLLLEALHHNAVRLKWQISITSLFKARSDEEILGRLGGKRAIKKAYELPEVAQEILATLINDHGYIDNAQTLKGLISIASEFEQQYA